MAMEQIGMFEAKTHFSEVVDRVVQEGRSVTVIRHGEAVVDITPTRSKAKNNGCRTHEQLQQELAKLREEVEPMTVEEIVELVHQGRN